MFGVLRPVREVVNQQGVQLRDFDEKTGGAASCKEDANAKLGELTGKLPTRQAIIPGIDKSPRLLSHGWELQTSRRRVRGMT
jgi:hypothetical protein